VIVKQKKNKAVSKNQLKLQSYEEAGYRIAEGWQ
jgi:hypothetical protein